MMQQFARLKFSGNSLRVSDKWVQPSNQEHYGKAFKDSEKSSAPDTTVPPLFTPVSMNKYHTDTQKKLTADIGGFIDKTCSAICSAWSQWQSMSTLVGVMIAGPVASVGQIVGPPLLPFILASGAMNTPMMIQYTTTIATVISNAWLSFTATVKVPGMPWYPAFTAFPGPVAPPMPNVPCPFAVLTQVPVSISANMLKNQMTAMQPETDKTNKYSTQIFDAIADAFEKCYDIWKVSTMVTNVLGTGPIPTFAPPYVPVGPVVGGVGTMTPGGFV